jgi:hypothetical protein
MPIFFSRNPSKLSISGRETMKYELLLVTAARILTGNPRADAPVRNGRMVA